MFTNIAPRRLNNKLCVTYVTNGSARLTDLLSYRAPASNSERGNEGQTSHNQLLESNDLDLHGTGHGDVCSSYTLGSMQHPRRRLLLET